MGDSGMINTSGVALTGWKEEMLVLMEAKYGKLNKKKVFEYLDKIIVKRCRNPKIIIANNYLNIEVKTDLLATIDYIETNQIIIGGDACLYKPHPYDEKEVHLLIKFIKYLKVTRDILKGERKNYAKGTFKWLAKDLGQNNVKIKTNTLYGALGCKSFFLYNKFLAASITNCGKQIICTASLTFENFLGVRVKYNFESEVFTFIRRIRAELKDSYPNGIDCSPFYFSNMKSKVKDKLVSKCAFVVTTEFIQELEYYLDNCTDDELVMLYYKNNMLEFSKHPIIKAKLKRIFSQIQSLRRPELNDLKECGLYDDVKDLNEFYYAFVMYTEPMFDRVRKTMFTDRDKVLYTDTDSTFLALNEWVTYIKEDVLDNHYCIEELEMNFAAVNIMTIILGTVIHWGLQKMCYGMNIRKEWAELLTMKNEFYMIMIVFTNSKKRYIADSALQEGDLLRDKKTGEIGYPEIKGFDFKKSVVKPFIREYFTNLSIYEVLRAKEIRVDQLYLKLINLENEILTSVRAGSTEYFKQAKVQLLETYADPYRLQGVRGVLLWNCLFEDIQLELPVDVDIVPIKEITSKRNREWFRETYPDLYAKVERDFFNSPNPSLSKMDLKVIAKPKTSIELPAWFYDLVDEQKIVSDIKSLYYPIMESLGLQTQVAGKTKYLTNMVEL